MSRPQFTLRILRGPVLTGGVSVLLGLLFLGFASSIFGSLSTHFSLAVMGCAFLAMGLNRPAAARWLTIPLGLLNLVTFVGYITFGPPGLDTLIIEAAWPKAPKYYSGDLNADVGYALTAVAILLLTKPDWKFRWRPIALVLVGSAVVGLGFVGLAGYLTGLPTAYGLRRLISISLNSIVCPLLLGAGLLAMSWRQSRLIPAERNAWLLVAIAASGVVLSTSLWQALMLVEKLPIETAQQFRSSASRIVLTFGLLTTAVMIAAASLVRNLRNLNEELRGHVERAEKELAERKRAEETLEEKLKELARTHDQLGDFLRAGSHDLQQPLRPIVCSSQLLAERYRGKLDAEADEFIDYLVAGAARIKSLIDGLLAYSRLEAGPAPLASTSGEAILRRALENLHAAIEEAGAEISHGPMPALEADGAQLGQVFQNILGNALKFHGPEPPRVHVSAERVPGAWRFSVRDNGIGIRPEFSRQVFDVFKQFHPRSEYPGTGIGLAICKKIIERHGGRIWFESEPGHGSVFYFTVPAAPENLSRPDKPPLPEAVNHG